MPVTNLMRLDLSKFNGTVLMNFDTGTKLADYQQDIFTRICNNQPIPPSTLSRLEQNYWVKAAETLAPSNLVVRQYCLIDMLRNYPINYNRIRGLVDKLSYASHKSGRIWSEGHSYWCYVKPFIVKACTSTKPRLTGMMSVVEEIDTGFCATAYNRGSVWYPAPFGDLRDAPLGDEFQKVVDNNHISTKGCVMKRSSSFYTIKGWSIGLNPHTPARDRDINIVGGVPEGFVFYTGYDKKYSSVIDEWADILSPRRVFSFFKK